MVQKDYRKWLSSTGLLSPTFLTEEKKRSCPTTGQGERKLTVTLIERWAYVLAVICYAPLPPRQLHINPAAGPPAQHGPAAQIQTVLSQPLPPLKGDNLKVQVVQVLYAPGGSSQPHSHPCPVIGYVLEGAVRMQVKGGEEKIYRAGESFYEAPNGVHLVSANASKSLPARFLATFVCDHQAPLTSPVSTSHEGRQP